MKRFLFENLRGKGNNEDIFVSNEKYNKIAGEKWKVTRQIYQR